jgi:hypothetical protein
MYPLENFTVCSPDNESRKGSVIPGYYRLRMPYLNQKYFRFQTVSDFGIFAYP